MNSNRNSFQHTAIAALAGLALGAVATTSLAAGRGASGATKVGQAPITNGEATAVPFVAEGEGGSNSNDVFDPINPMPAIDVTDDEHFVILATLGASDTDGLSRDVDYFLIGNLIPLQDYIITSSDEIAGKMIIGWFDKSGNMISSESNGMVNVLADGNGLVLIGLSSLDDMNFDGMDDVSTNHHGLRGDYTITIEIIGAHGDVNGDALVDINDVHAMLNLIGSTDSPSADLTRDGIVDEHDLRILAETVTDKRARKLAVKKANKFEKQKRKAAKRAQKLADKIERRAARRALRGH